MRVLLTGAAGFSGIEGARRLATAGHSARVLIRRPSRSRVLTGLNVEPVFGDLVSVPSLERAVEGVEWLHREGTV